MIYIGSPCYNMDYLEHHGIKNQRWHFRRWQNYDGTLTPAGKIRYRKLQKLQDKYAKKEEKLLKKKAKPIYEMSDDEIKSEIARMDLEKKYRDHLREYYNDSKTENKLFSAGKEVFKTVIKPALTDVGKKVTTSVAGHKINEFGKSLGLEYELYVDKNKKKDKDKD